MFFASRGKKVTGIDFLAEAITIAKRKAVERGLTAKFLVMDALALKELPEGVVCGGKEEGGVNQGDVLRSESTTTSVNSVMT